MSRKTNGFTLTEVMILSLVLMLGVFGITEVIDKSLAQQQQSQRVHRVLHAWAAAGRSASRRIGWPVRET